MSTSTMDAPVAVTPPARPAIRLTFRGVLRSEWVKLRSVRSSALTLLGAALVLLAAGLAFASVLSGGELGDASDGVPDPTDIALSGVLFAQLIIGVLGVMVVSSEYSTGMIRSTLTGVPSRLPVLVAKVAVVAGTVFPAMLVAAFAAFFGSQVILDGSMATAAIGDAGVLRAIVGSAAALTGVTVIGVAFGSILRSTAGAISTLFGLVFLAPGLGQLLLPASWRDDVLKYLPSNASTSFTSVV
ncbi:MAG: ABC transporter permease, partial [Kibdelosporangium sp.]